MASGEAAGSEFRARAGTLTLFFMTSSLAPEMLLEILEGALHGGMLGAPDEDDPEDALDYFEDDEDEDDGPASGLDLEAMADTEPKMRTSPKGAQALYVAFNLERWLRNCPEGPLRIGPTGGDATATLVCAWSATVTHALAWEPRTLAELHRAVEILSLATLQEYLEAMIRTGLAVALPDSDGETRYAATEWLREGLSPLAASARFERIHSEEGTAPPDKLDVEALFQLALPLLKLPAGLSGSCRLGVQIPGGPPLLAGATAQVGGGRVASSSPQLDEDPHTWVTGGTLDWLDALVDPTDHRLKAAGDLSLVHALLYGLHERLFGIPVAER
ncbi:MAG: hypothetical protein WBM00_01980 [Solirubrobacterales bacterium]